MKQSETIQASLPEDIALKIASCLQVGDLCALGSCSRFWRDLCGSDFLWESLTRQRWPSLDVFTESSDSSSFRGWRDFYVKLHTKMARRAMSVVRRVNRCADSSSFEILKAIEHLNSMGLGFKDVEMFLFRPGVNVLVNLVGLHYCVHCLEVPEQKQAFMLVMAVAFSFSSYLNGDRSLQQVVLSVGKMTDCVYG